MSDFIDEYELPSCPNCGCHMEYVSDISHNHGLIRCTSCLWSQVASVIIIDDDWLNIGSYHNPYKHTRIGDWLPYLPNDPRREGLQDWQLARPHISEIKTIDMTVNSQRLYTRTTIGTLANTLCSISFFMAKKEPYILRKIQKMEASLDFLSKNIPLPEKKSSVASNEDIFRKELYSDIIKSFCPKELLSKDLEEISIEEIQPYLWGFIALCYWHWLDMLKCEKNCQEVLKNVKKPWNALRMSLEAFCTRYDSEILFCQMAYKARDYRDKKYLVNRRKKKKK